MLWSFFNQQPDSSKSYYANKNVMKHKLLVFEFWHYVMKSVVFIINKLIKIKFQARYHKYIGKKGVLYKVMVVRNIVIFSLLIDDSEILTMKTESVGSRSNAGTTLI